MTNLTCNIFMFGSYLMFNELVTAYITSLTHIGFQKIYTQFICDETNINLLPPQDVNFFIVGQLKLMHSLSFQTQYLTNYKKNVSILLLLEQNNIKSRLAQLNIKFKHIFTIFQNTHQLKTLIGCKQAVFCPLGWSPAYVSNLTPLTTHKQNDIFLFGSLTYRRKEIADKLQIINQVGLYGKLRTHFIINSKVNLMLRAYPTYCLPQLHYLLIACNSKLVICDIHKSYAPFIPKVHIIPSTVRNLPKTIDYWVTHNQERQQLEQFIANDLKNNYSHTTFLTNALTKIGIIT